MVKRPLTVSVRTVDGKEIRATTVEEALSGTTPPIENNPPVEQTIQTVVVPVNVAVEVANA